jgi:diguanylate cyclase (GGDEF)-like protein/PAS domain S-box-containing protein
MKDKVVTPGSGPQSVKNTAVLGEVTFRELFNHLRSGVVIYTAVEDGGNFIIRDINKAVERIEKVKKENLINKKVTDVFPGIRDFGLFEVFQKVWKTGTPEHHPISLYKDNKLSGWRENYVYKLPSGEIVAVYDDVTEQKQAEEKIRLSAQEWQATFDSISDLVSIQDTDFRLVRVNKSYADAVKMKPEELIGRHCYEVIHRTSCPIDNCPHQQTLKTKMTTIREVYEPGLNCYLEVSTSPIINENGEVTATVHIAKIINDRKRIETELNLRAQLLDSASDSIIVDAMDGNIIYANETAYKSRGYTKEELLDMNVGQLLAPQYKTGFADRIARIKTEGSHVFEVAHVRKDGTLMPIEVHVRTVELDGEKVMFSIDRDITERKKTEEELNLRANLLDSANDSIMVNDYDGKILYANETAYKSRGYTKEEFMKLNIREILTPEGAAGFAGRMARIKITGDLKYEVGHVRKNGTVLPVEGHARKIVSGDREIVLSVLRDITERKQIEDKLIQVATHDPLTGLPNRALMEDRFTVALASARRKGTKMAIAMLDLDHFKTINDSMGHAAGDQILKTAGSRLTDILRHSDTVARIGGDEFIMLFTDIDRVEEGIVIAKRILSSFQKPITIDGKNLNISISIGIAIYPEQGTDAITLMKKADAALYYVKEHGRSNYHISGT